MVIVKAYRCMYNICILISIQQLVFEVLHGIHIHNSMRLHCNSKPWNLITSYNVVMFHIVLFRPQILCTNCIIYCVSMHFYHDK